MPQSEGNQFWLRSLLASPTLAELSSGRDNNFNLMRFFAASLVIVHHARMPVTEILFQFTGHLESNGSVAVLIFFVISGFLVTQSFTRNSLGGFFAARALRIFPALWVAVPFTIIVSSFASAVPWGRYLTHPQTLKYWLHNSFVWDLEYSLPGAFLHVPMAREVNGSLWTLPAELRMYWFCALLGILGLYALRPAFNALFLAIVLIGCTVKPAALPLVNNINVAQWEFAFLIGMFCFVNREKVRLNLPVAVLLFLSTLLIDDPDMGHLYIVPAFAYMTLCLSLHPALFFRPFTRLGDYSYGLYIFAFPLQQQMYFYFPTLHSAPRLLITYPIILAVAIVSWHLIEEPALRLKKRFRPVYSA